MAVTFDLVGCGITNWSFLTGVIDPAPYLDIEYPALLD
jgi:hypothetical protein